MPCRHVALIPSCACTANKEVRKAPEQRSCETAVEMVDEIPGQKQVTLGADKNYDTQEMGKQLRERKATPHVAPNNKGRRRAIDGRTTRHSGYRISQRAQKKVEESQRKFPQDKRY